MRILVLNGPNLNLLGSREPEIYGRETLADIETLMRRRAGELGNVELKFIQSNHEGALIDAMHEHHDWDGFIVNFAGLTHTSIALADAVTAVNVPTVEVHLSNIHRREPFRHHSFIARVAWGQLTGFGFRGYLAALEMLHGRLSEDDAE